MIVGTKRNRKYIFSIRSKPYLCSCGFLRSLDSQTVAGIAKVASEVVVVAAAASVVVVAAVADMAAFAADAALA